MSKRTWQIARSVTTLVALTVALGTFSPGTLAADDAGPDLNDLRSVDDLKSIFDADAGHPRLLLLLSPT